MSSTFARYDGYGENYRKLLPLLRTQDFIENACRLGALRDGEGVRLHCLGRDYRITRDGVLPLGEKPVDINLCSVLIFYVTSRGAGATAGEFVLLSRLTGMIEGGGSLSNDMFSSPLVREFGGSYRRFADALKRLGGEELPAQGSGKHIWRLQVLPCIPIQLVYYEADDEFPVEIQIMFDRTAPRFLEFECLAFLSGSVSRALIRGACGDG